MEQNLPWNLIAGKVSENISQSQEDEFENWINGKQPNNEVYSEVEQIWQDYDKLKPDVTVDVDVAWDKANKKIEDSYSGRSWSKISFALKVAAIILVFLTFGALYYSNLFTDAPHLTEVFESTNDVEDFKLEDGSYVKLNSQTILKYPEKFDGDTRETYLKGEAFFTISKDKEHPFIIRTDKIDVKVLGTSFNIRAVEGEDYELVTVLEGTVSVAVQSSEHEIILIAGEQGKISKTGVLSKAKHLGINDLGWNTGALLFKDTPLSDVAQKIGKYYNISINIGDDELNTKKITAFYNNESLENILKILELNLDAQIVKQNNNSYTILIIHN